MEQAYKIWILENGPPTWNAALIYFISYTSANLVIFMLMRKYLPWKDKSFVWTRTMSVRIITIIKFKHIFLSCMLFFVFVFKYHLGNICKTLNPDNVFEIAHCVSLALICIKRAQTQEETHCIIFSGIGLHQEYIQWARRWAGSNTREEKNTGWMSALPHKCAF